MRQKSIISRRYSLSVDELHVLPHWSMSGHMKHKVHNGKQPFNVEEGFCLMQRQVRVTFMQCLGSTTVVPVHAHHIIGHNAQGL